MLEPFTYQLAKVKTLEGRVQVLAIGIVLLAQTD